jgi:hypothetical protein
MKQQTFLFTLLLLAAFGAQAQSNAITIYGFKQLTSGGMQKRGDIDETGRLIKQEPAPALHYAIYLANSSGNNVYPVQLWIQGKAYAVKVKPFQNNLVVPANTDAPVAKLKTLLPETGGTIYRLMPAPLAVDKSNDRASALAAQNDVVVLYRWKGKLEYGVLKKFVDAEPVILQ